MEETGARARSVVFIVVNWCETWNGMKRVRHTRTPRVLASVGWALSQHNLMRDGLGIRERKRLSAAVLFCRKPAGEHQTGDRHDCVDIEMDFRKACPFR